MNYRIGLSALPLSCIALAACTGIPYDPANNNDITPPAISLQVEGQDPGSRYLPNPTANDTGCYPKQAEFCPNIKIVPTEVGAATPTPPPSIRIHENGEASIVASASDNGSGIKSLVLMCQRHVYYNWDAANQTEADALLAPETTEHNNTISNGQVPESAIIQRTLNMPGQLLWRNANGTLQRGHRAVIKCNAEAKNFNGQGVFSQAVIIWAQDRSIRPD